MNAYTDAMRRYFTFSGRSTRSQFWFYHLTLLGLTIVAYILDIVLNGGNEPQPLISALVVIGHYIPTLALIVRRLHDAEMSGWLVLVCLIPLVGLIAFVVFGCMGSTRGANRFGAAAGSNAASSPATAQTGGPAPTAGASAVERIEKLAALQASGAISAEEFTKMKADILAGKAV